MFSDHKVCGFVVVVVVRSFLTIIDWVYSSTEPVLQWWDNSNHFSSVLQRFIIINPRGLPCYCFTWCKDKIPSCCRGIKPSSTHYGRHYQQGFYWYCNGACWVPGNLRHCHIHHGRLIHVNQWNSRYCLLTITISYSSSVLLTKWNRRLGL